LLARAGAQSVLLREPGFHHVFPALRRAVPGARIVGHAGGCACEAAHLERLGCRVLAAGIDPAIEQRPDQDALLLLCGSGVSAWRRLWLPVVKGWIRRRIGARPEGPAAAAAAARGSPASPAARPGTKRTLILAAMIEVSSKAKGRALMDEIVRLPSAIAVEAFATCDAAAVVSCESMRYLFATFVLEARGGDGAVGLGEAWTAARPRLKPFPF
jgi:hypothetical protein